MKRLFKIVIAAAGVAALLSLIPGRAVTYHAERTVAEAAEVVVTMPPPEALAFVYGPDEEIPTQNELMRATVSGYTSSADETDDTPEINASGLKPGPGSIACPARYPFGTRVIIAGDEYACDDRMNERYAHGDHFDIWFPSKAEAMHWGRQTVTVEVVQ